MPITEPRRRVFLALHGLFGVGRGAIVGRSAGSIGAYPAATFAPVFIPGFAPVHARQVHAL